MRGKDCCEEMVQDDGLGPDVDVPDGARPEARPGALALMHAGPDGPPQPPDDPPRDGPRDCPEGTSRHAAGYTKAVTLPDLFEVVKELVECELGLHRAGLMLGMVDLGVAPEGFVGAYFVVGGNAIVVNRQAMSMVETRSPELLKAYRFYLLLHEYLHAVGIIDEARCRSAAATLARRAFGSGHEVARIARDFGSIFRGIVAPGYGFMPPGEPRIDLIPGFDRSSVTYIQ
jgi:hypothetical protein